MDKTSKHNRHMATTIRLPNSIIGIHITYVVNLIMVNGWNSDGNQRIFVWIVMVTVINDIYY